MKFINIVGVASAYENAVQTCCLGVPFHPELPDGMTGSNEFSVAAGVNPYAELLKSCIGIAGRGGVHLCYDGGIQTALSDQEIESYINDLDKRQDVLLEQIKETGVRLLYDRQVLDQINMMQDLHVNVDELFTCKVVKIRFGRIPVENLGKIKLYEQNPYLYFMPFSQDEHYCWCVYFTTEAREEEIDALMNSLFFERIRIPDFVHGTPEEARAEMHRILSDLEQQEKDARANLITLWEAEKAKFIKIYDRIRFLHDSYELRRYTLRYRQSFYISGWVEELESEKFANQFKDLKGVDCLVLEPDRELGYEPPVKLKNYRLFAPFESLVSLYGMPDYHELDPTPIVAMSFMLLFGIMFADVGQGAICILLGILLWKTKKMFLGRILQRIGAVSMVFGLIFGSVFGNETLLNPMFEALGFAEKPLEVLSSNGTNFILLASICLGAALILMAMVLNIINGFREKDIGRILVSHNGIIGIVLFGGTLIAVAATSMFQINVFTPGFIIGVIIVPLLVIFLKEPLEHLLKKQRPHKPDSIPEFIMQNFFELFEIILSFFSNTLSFIRVGAFVLSHAGMMMVVMSIAEAVGGVGAPFVWVFGNLLVMGLEGMVVAIQVLRLEFYELFSRFYSGTGRSFEPFQIQYEIQDDGVES